MGNLKIFIRKNGTACLLTIYFIFSFFTCGAQNLDIDVLKKLNLHRNRSLDGMFRNVTDYGAPVAYSIPMFLWIVAAIRKNRGLQKKSQYVIASSILSLLSSTLVKHLVNRPRPFISYPFIENISTGGSPSFPSGHASDAFTLAIAISLAFPRWYIFFPSFLWAIAVGYSRMHLGVHYPSDILGSILIALLSSLICFKYLGQPVGLSITKIWRRSN
ncbi:MAG: hypothetical protein JWQ96_116 [Segetibacter sp.]|nr:hypothetical protein [Segetibacter sp.]